MAYRVAFGARKACGARNTGVPKSTFLSTYGEIVKETSIAINILMLKSLARPSLADKLQALSIFRVSIWYVWSSVEQISVQIITEIYFCLYLNPHIQNNQVGY